MTWTKLHEACERHAMEGDNVLKLLEKCKDDILSVNEHGSTALHLLCWGNPNPKFVEALLHYSPQAASAQDLNGNTPLHVACACSSTDKHLVQILLSSFPPAVSVVNCEGLMPLHMACRYASQNEPVIGLLLEQYPYALRSPIKMGSPAPKARKSLAGKPTDHPLMDPQGRSGCGFSQHAMSTRYDLLLSSQVRDGSYPLHMAVQSGAPCSVVEMLIREERDALLLKNKFGETPIHLALRDGAPAPDTVCDIAELLLKYSPSEVPKTRDERGNLPLHVAVTHGCSVHVAKGLLEAWPGSIHERSAPPNSLTALELAIQHGKCSDNVLRLLSISSEADAAE